MEMLSFKVARYLPSFSMNYVAIYKDLEKLPPQLYQTDMKICCDQGYNGIRVVIATKWRHYLFYLQLFLGTVNGSSKIVQYLFTYIALQSNLLVRTPLYYGQFPMSRQNSHTFS